MQCRQAQQVTSNTFLTLSSHSSFLPERVSARRPLGADAVFIPGRGHVGLVSISRCVLVFSLMSMKSLQVSVCWNQWGKKVWMTRVSTISNTHQLEAGQTCIFLKFYKWRVFTENTLRFGLKVFILLCPLPHTTLVQPYKTDYSRNKGSYFVSLCVFVCVRACVCLCQSRMSVLIQTIANLSTERMEGVSSFVASNDFSALSQFDTSCHTNVTQNQLR
jgi:hypothetical protein